MTSFNREAYERARSRLEVARNDLEELDQQVEDGEIDQVTAADLRSGYEAELKSAEAALAAAGTPPAKAAKKEKPNDAPEPSSKKRAPSESLEKGSPTGGWNKRILVGAGILVAAIVFILISVQSSSEPDPTAGPSTAADGSGTDPCAELAAALSDHADNGFRLALANCYLTTGQAMSAVEHYRTVLEAENATAEEASEGAWGLGIMNYQIGRLDESESYLRQALELNPDNPDAKFYLGMILVYDLNRGDEAIPLLEDFLAFPGVPPEMAADVEAALEVARGDGAGS